MNFIIYNFIQSVFQWEREKKIFFSYVYMHFHQNEKNKMKTKKQQKYESIYLLIQLLDSEEL